MVTTEIIVIALLLLPHVVLGIAWIYWLRSGSRFQPPRWRSMILFAALLCNSMNVLLYWVYIVWLHYHYKTEAYKIRDVIFNICQIFVVATIIGALVGGGRARTRATFCVAGVLGWFLWVTTAIGVL